MKDKPILFVFFGDTHCGSRLGLCPPQGVSDAHGGRYIPGTAGLWLWDCWIHAWHTVSEIRRKHRARLWLGVTGDTVDGMHHLSGAHELISTNPEEHSYIAHETFSIPKKLRPERVFAVRGTQVHVGPDGASEESVAKYLRAERWEHKYTADIWRILVHNQLFDLRHHPATRGTRPHTRQAGIDREARIIWDTYKDAEARAIMNQEMLDMTVASTDPNKRHGRDINLTPPKVAVRGHFHAFDSSSRWGCPVWATICPSMQLATGYVRQRAAPEAISEVGLVAYLVEPNGTIEQFPILYFVEPPKPWTEPDA